METFRQENLFLAIACRLRSRSMFCSANANITAIQRQNAVSVYSKCKQILHFRFARRIEYPFTFQAATDGLKGVIMCINYCEL